MTRPDAGAPAGGSAISLAGGSAISLAGGAPGPRPGGPVGPELAAGLTAIDFSGVVLAVGPEGVLAEVALGIADRATGRPITARSRFGTASASKLFTAATLVRQFERGSAAPGTRVVDVLDAELRPRDLDPRVTLEHLLTHTSGISDYCDEDGGEPYEAVWLRANPAAVRTPRDLLPLFADLPALAAPGAEVRYCNAGFVLAGLAVEVLAGCSFYEAVADAVLQPAGMSDTWYPALDDVIPDVAVGYLAPPDDDPGNAWRSNLFAIPARGQPDGGAFSTAADLVRFLDAFRDGRLVGAPWRDEMLRPRVHDEREGASYGLGWWISGEGSRRWVGHPGGDPGYVARVRRYQEAGISLVVLANRANRAGPAAELAETLLVP
jgi:D-alanyl-D-alanine carboxypeptidase